MAPEGGAVCELPGSGKEYVFVLWNIPHKQSIIPAGSVHLAITDHSVSKSLGLLKIPTEWEEYHLARIANHDLSPPENKYWEDELEYPITVIETLAPGGGTLIYMHRL
jgi:hypothetical protein